jgi:hypothetical protein
LTNRCQCNESKNLNLSLPKKLKDEVKVKLFLHRPWKPLGLQEVEDLTFSDIRFTDGGKVVSPTHRPLFTPKKIPGTDFCYRLSRRQGHSAAGRIRYIEKST